MIVMNNHCSFIAVLVYNISYESLLLPRCHQLQPPMPGPYKHPPEEKPMLHPRNPHRGRYDFKHLIAAFPGLAPFVKPNPYGDESIDFSNAAAVKALNAALLRQYYGIEHWEIPPGYLCPPIPGRADYIHYLADLLGSSNGGKIPTGKKIRCLDVGVGANCIYPIIGAKAYGWSFVGSDIDPVAIASAEAIITANPVLTETVTCRLQANPKDVFAGIIRSDEYFDLTICNPPFHASAEEARSGTMRKVSNLGRAKAAKPVLNFGGQQGELWCEGGEVAFIGNMVRQSGQFATSCYWFSTLVSKEANLPAVYKGLETVGAGEVRTIPMGQGNKVSRVVAWSFLGKRQMEVWRKGRFKISKPG
jgi:23S rRNA (adenine1618-N6)-methyltransferase